MESVEARVLRTVQPYAQASLTLASNMAEAGMSSLDMICALQAIEEEFVCTVPDEKFRQIQTVADIVSFVSTGLPNAA